MVYDKKILESSDIWEYVFNSLPDLIAILDTNHNVIRINKAMAERLGVSPDEGVGLQCYQVVHHTNAPIDACPHSKLLKDGLEHTGEVQEDNLGGYFLVTASPIFDSDGNLLGCVHIARDITDRRQMEEKLKKALEDKEMLISEVHHRVKNNLMMISSLLNIQSTYIQDQEIKDIFLESQIRAKSMALIHNKLYQTGNVKRIDFSEYLRSLATEIMHSCNIRNKVDLKLDIQKGTLDVDKAIPLGLIITEIMVNSFKHAFVDDGGEINITLSKTGDLFELTISDNGIGIPEDFDFRTQGNMGMTLINGLIDQIEGNIVLVKHRGTKFIIQFHDNI
ncbi:histidine kinase dimerization/phosphoacceptor domain -containing protein [Methanobacterium alcaliphilum]|uniref:histidine kinase dimerization/phosphoacceptor domain -containing protein n=1 Tax=Methanobacterium alcaliphilum TaxID=392018 RepID=UPI00200AE183|nr:PAS domain-containing protein [Methanobacterium alcaliphilum]